MKNIQFFDVFQLLAFTCLVCLALGRALILYLHGICFVAIDRQRSVAQVLADLILGLALLFWVYETIVSVFCLSTKFVPQRLDVVLIDTFALKVAGAVMLAVALVMYGLALASMRDSWRVSIDRQSPGELVTHGIFAWSRNPIYISLELFGVGTLLIQGRMLFFLLAPIIAVMFHLLIRREEQFLLKHYGDAYRNYCARVGRYVTFRTTYDAKR